MCLYIYIYIHIYIYIYTHIYRALLLRKHSPCNPAAETALQPLVWCSES